jgi:uncharacterized membrane protein YqaE (UPF0057 family)
MFWFLPLIALYIPPIAMLIAFIVYFWKILVAIFSIIPPIIEMAITLFLNPTKLLNDIITGVIVGITLVIEAIFGYMSPAKYGATAKNGKKLSLDTIKQNCYSTSYMNIILLIICPPFAVFQALGVKIHEIAICTLLTVYTYYFPGLLYAILIISHKMKNSKNKKCST